MPTGYHCDRAILIMNHPKSTTLIIIRIVAVGTAMLLAMMPRTPVLEDQSKAESV